MQPLREEISEKFIESMVDKVIDRLSAKFDELDISLDYVAALISGESGVALGAATKTVSRRIRRPSPRHAYAGEAEPEA